MLSLVVGITIIATGLFLGWYNNKIVPVNSAPTAHYLQEPHNPLSFMSNWDGPAYLNIASYGYVNVSSTNFFPLYPLAIYELGLFINSPLICALVISWVCFVGAIYFFIKILKKLYKIEKSEEVVRGLVFFVLFPTAVFMIATYTEALFAMLALGAIYFTLERKYLPAAFLTMLCGAAHITGIFLLLLVAMLMFEQGEKAAKIVPTIAVGALGYISYMDYLWSRFGQPLAFITTQQKGHGWLHGGYSNLVTSLNFFNAIFIALLGASIIYWWKRRKSFAIYSFLFLLVPLVGKQFGGFNRYALMAFPVQFMMYEYLRNKKLAYPLALAVLGVFWTFFLLRYAGGYIGG